MPAPKPIRKINFMRKRLAHGITRTGVKKPTGEKRTVITNGDLFYCTTTLPPLITTGTIKIKRHQLKRPVPSRLTKRKLRQANIILKKLEKTGVRVPNYLKEKLKSENPIVANQIVSSFQLYLHLRKTNPANLSITDAERILVLIAQGEVNKIKKK